MRRRKACRHCSGRVGELEADKGGEGRAYRVRGYDGATTRWLGGRGGAFRTPVPHQAGPGRRRVRGFQAVGSALLRRRRLQIGYHGRGRDQTRDREVSPQRLVHYRDNWYLDAWCHAARGLRSFAVDAVRGASVLDKTAIDVNEAELNAVLGAGYGIYAGKRVQWARLRFSAERAGWVAAETWHPRQRGRFEPAGTYVLELPYADPRELVMDILRHVPEVEMLGPAALRDEVRRKLEIALSRVTP